MIDISKVKVGDFVTARLSVEEVDIGDTVFPLRLSFSGWMDIDRLVAHEPRGIAVGDFARAKNGAGAGREVVWTDGRHILLAADEMHTPALCPVERYERVA